MRRFEKRKRTDGTPAWHFMGYVSFYSFFFWPDSRRLRLAYVYPLALGLASCPS